MVPIVLMVLIVPMVPMVPVCQPYDDVAMQKYMSGYTYWPCREPDFRFLVKGT